MNNVCIISSDKVFARMLEIELCGLALNVGVINEKISIPALNIATEKADIVIYDCDYQNGDIEFVISSSLPFVVFSSKTIEELPGNVKGCFERPFLITDFLECVKSVIASNETEDMQILLTPVSENVYKMELDPFLKQAKIGEKIIKFSPKEYSLLSLLCKNRGRTVSRKEVLDTVWGKDYDDSNNVDNVYINYLRKKLDAELGIKLIYTVRGKGYMLK